MKHLFLFLVIVSSIPAFAVQYPATGAVLSGNATKNGDYVEMRDGDMTFNSVNVSQAGMYDINIHYKQNYGDTKTQNLVINGASAGTVTFPKTATWQDIAVVTPLKSGNNTIAITNSWGWVDIQYIDVVPHVNTPFNLDKNLVNQNANEATKKMFAFMQENFQKKIISGVMTNDVLSGNNAVTLNNQTEVKYIREKSSNKTPALVGFDFMHGTGKKSDEDWFKNYTSATISLAKELYQRNGIPAFCWHWKDPLKNDEAFYAPSDDPNKKTTNFDLTQACTNANCTAWNTSSNAYIKMVEDIDIVAGYLKELQTAGVPVLWRPLHEASGGWFWWGAKGAAPLKLLYKLVFDRLTNHHNLNNLIWVWTSEGADYDWYPGDEYADIIGRDFYYNNAETTVNHASLVGEFEKLKKLFGIKKMIALSENGSVPSPENLIADEAGWSYFMSWYGKYVTQANSASDWNNIMKHDYVITLEDMPKWDNYTPDISPILNSKLSTLNSNSQPITYYSIKGEPLGSAKPQRAGVYIVKQGYSVKKIVVK
jgi:mannan endo-1,4-beta-mannosidase